MRFPVAVAAALILSVMPGAIVAQSSGDRDAINPKDANEGLAASDAVSSESASPSIDPISPNLRRNNVDRRPSNDTAAAASKPRADEELPIKTFIFLDEAGNPVVRPGTTWEEYERVVRSLEKDQRDRRRTITFHRTTAKVKLPARDAEATNVDVTFEITIAPDQDNWVAVPLGLMGFHLLQTPIVAPSAATSAASAKRGGNSVQKTRSETIEHRVVVDPRRGGYVLEFRLAKPQRLTVTMNFEAAVVNDNQQSMQFDLPSAVTTITLKNFAARGQLSADNVAVEGRGGELVQVRGQDLVVQSGGGPLSVTWGRDDENDATDLLEATTRMDLRFDDLQSSPIASVSMSLRNLRGSVRQFTLQLPENTVLLDTPRLGIDGRELGFQTLSGGDQSRLSFVIPSREKQSRVEITYELRWIGGSGTAAKPLGVTVPSIEDVLRHRGSVTLSTDAPSRLRWRPAQWVRAVGRSVVDGGTTVDRFDFDRQSFELPVYLVGQIESMRLTCNSELLIESSTAAIRMAASLTGRGETGRLLLDTAGWKIVSVRDSDTKLLLETYRESASEKPSTASDSQSTEGQETVTEISPETTDRESSADPISPLIIAGGGGTAGGSTTSLEIVATRAIDKSQSPARLPIPVLRVESASPRGDSDDRSKMIPAERSLTVGQSGRTGLIVDLAASTSVTRREFGAAKSDPRSFGDQQRVTTFFFGDQVFDGQIDGDDGVGDQAVGDRGRAELVGSYLQFEPPMDVAQSGVTTLTSRNQSVTELSIDVIAKFDLEGRLDFVVPGYKPEQVEISVLVDDFPAVVQHLGEGRFRLISERLDAGATELSFTIKQQAFNRPATRAAGVSGSPPTSDPPNSNPPTSDPPTSNPPTSNPPNSNPPNSNPPNSNPPNSNPPNSNPPNSDPPNSNPPNSDPPTAPVQTLVMPWIDGSNVTMSQPMLLRVNDASGKSLKFSVPARRIAVDGSNVAIALGSTSGGTLANKDSDGESDSGGGLDATGNGSDDAVDQVQTDARKLANLPSSFELTVTNAASLPIRVDEIAADPIATNLAIRRGVLFSEVGTRTRREKFNARFQGAGDLEFGIHAGQIDVESVRVLASIDNQPVAVEQLDGRLRIKLPAGDFEAISNESSNDGGPISRVGDTWRTLSLEIWAVGQRPYSLGKITPLLIPPLQVDSVIWDLTMPTDWHMISYSASARSLMRWQVNGMSLRRQMPSGFDADSRQSSKVGNRYLLAANDAGDVSVRLASRVMLWMVFGLLVMIAAAAIFHAPSVRGPQSVLLATVAVGGLMVFSPDAAVIFGQIMLLVMMLVAVVLAINSLLRQSLRGRVDMPPFEKPPFILANADRQRAGPSSDTNRSGSFSQEQTVIPRPTPSVTASTDVLGSQQSPSMRPAVSGPSQSNANSNAPAKRQPAGSTPIADSPVDSQSRSA